MTIYMTFENGSIIKETNVYAIECVGSFDCIRLSYGFPDDYKTFNEVKSIRCEN